MERRFVNIEKGLGPAGRIAVVRFDRGDNINALSQQAMRELRDGNGALIAANDNWRDGPELEIEQSKLAPTNDLESAIITTLPSGPYTAVIHEKNGQSGIGLFEVYNLQNP